MIVRAKLLGVLLLASGTSWSPAAAQVTLPEAVRKGQAPYGDYAAHIMSPAVARQWKPQLPPVQLPADLALILRRRHELVAGKEAFRNTLALAPFYADDAVVLTGDNWVRGGDRAAEHARVQASLIFAGAQFGMVPVAYSRSGGAAWIAGYFTKGEGAALKRVGNFQLVLKKDRVGGWRIANETTSFRPPIDYAGSPAEELIAEMDAAGVRKTVVLGQAYWFSSPGLGVAPGEYARVRSENDWLAAQVARHPDRLVGFCSVNPLKDYALEEIARCARIPHIRGLKLHMGDANVDLKNPEHLERVRRVYQAANAARLAIASHVATQDPDYGREHAAIYLDKIFPMAPDIPIQIVHLAGHGPATGGEALIAFAEAAEAQHPAMRNVYIDVSGNMQSFTSKEELAFIAKTIRRFGVERVLFGTDRPASGPAYTAKEAWTQFRRLHLTEAEFRAIADNIPPYMEDR